MTVSVIRLPLPTISCPFVPFRGHKSRSSFSHEMARKHTKKERSPIRSNPWPEPESGFIPIRRPCPSVSVRARPSPSIRSTLSVPNPFTLQKTQFSHSRPPNTIRSAPETHLSRALNPQTAKSAELGASEFPYSNPQFLIPQLILQSSFVNLQSSIQKHGNAVG